MEYGYARASTNSDKQDIGRQKRELVDNQRMVVSARERKKPLKIGEDFYYISNGRERLQEVLEKICR